MKINTPLRFTILSSLLSSAFVVLFLFLTFEKILDYSLAYSVYFLLFSCLFIFLSLTIYFLLEFFINQKIRLLYRMIHNYKMSNMDMELNMQEDILSATEDDILKWANKNRSELIKLKEEEKFRREFVGNLAHELKTPIFSIQGYIITLIEGGLEDESVNKTFLNRALKGVERMNKIISDLDMITKFESERVNMDFSKYDIIEICKDIYESLELKAKENKINLKFSDQYDSPIFVKCDKDKIGQVIQNLVMNAINYSKEKCDIIISFSDLGSTILIEVEDNGLGIDQSHLSRLFERFYRVDKSRARNEGGSGLGLAIAKHIIEAHGHNIQVRSTLGKGSVFYFSLNKG